MGHVYGFTLDELKRSGAQKTFVDKVWRTKVEVCSGDKDSYFFFLSTGNGRGKGQVPGQSSQRGRMRRSSWRMRRMRRGPF